MLATASRACSSCTRPPAWKACSRRPARLEAAGCRRRRCRQATWRHSRAWQTSTGSPSSPIKSAARERCRSPTTERRVAGSGGVPRCVISDGAEGCRLTPSLAIASRRGCRTKRRRPGGARFSATDLLRSPLRSLRTAHTSRLPPGAGSGGSYATASGRSGSRNQAKGALARDEPGRVAHGDHVLHVSGSSTERPARSPVRVGLGITFCDSVTNAAGRRNDLLMMVSDEELLVASVGDEEAFAAFYRRHARPLAGFFMRRTGDAELAADLTAETFAAALAARRRFDPAKGAAIGWLYGIARHKLARTLAHGRVEARARRTLGMAPLVLDDEAIELVVTAEGDVVQLVQRLPVDQRAAIEARVVDEQEYEQIAAAAQTSEAVIRKRVSRGLASLRRKLEGPTP